MSRLLLALDTATEGIGLGLARLAGNEIELLVVDHRIAPRQANSQLLIWVLEVLASIGANVRDLGGVVVGRGPGSFTGARIGVAAAKGLAQGLGVPLAGVGTLDAIAWGMTTHEGLLGVVGDAMRGEVYPVLFRVASGHVTRLSPDRATAPAEVAVEWARETGGLPLLMAGNGLRKHADVFADALGARADFAPEELWWPDGGGLFGAFMAAGGAELLIDGNPARVLPVYTRLADAEEAERVRHGLGAAPTPDSGVSGGVPHLGETT